MRHARIGLVILVGLLLAACNSGMKAGLLTFKDEVLPSQVDVRHAARDPQHRYLLVETAGQEALLVWVGNEQSLLGALHVWASADGVIVRTLDGRVVGVSELRRHWQLVSESVDALSGVAMDVSGVRRVQTSDAQPGFQMGLVRTVDQRALSKPVSMPWLDASHNLHWLEEVDSTTGERLALYGLDSGQRTLAGQRCMTAQWCLRWQSWPAHASASAP